MRAPSATNGEPRKMENRLTIPSLSVEKVQVIARSWRDSLRVQARRPGDLIFRILIYVFVLLVIAIVAGVTWVLISSSWPTIQAFGLSFLTNTVFDPVHNIYGVAPALFGTIYTSLLAMLIALPLGIGTAVFLVEFCPRAFKGPLGFLVDSLAAIPSVVLGLWGFLFFAPWLQSTGEPWLAQHFGFLPFFQGTPHGVGLLAAVLILVVMILPIVTAISREVMLVTPRAQREALLALGATRWEVIRHVVLPFSRAGLLGAAILSLGRALGETIAVTMVIGNQATKADTFIGNFSLFNTGYTLASVIANQFSEATPGLFFSAVLEAGLLLLIITLLTNILARVLVARMGARASGGLNV